MKHLIMIICLMESDEVKERETKVEFNATRGN